MIRTGPQKNLGNEPENDTNKPAWPCVVRGRQLPPEMREELQVAGETRPFLFYTHFRTHLIDNVYASVY